MAKPIVLDLETQYSFREKDNDTKKLKVSVVGIYDYNDDLFKAFFEDELSQLWPILENASLIIGFNIKKFDLQVLAPYYVGNIAKLPVLDLLDEIKESLGKRISLGELAKATLGEGKTGHGLLALDLYRRGKLEELKKYCLDDVRLTRDLYQFGKKQGRVFYFSSRGKEEIKIDWGQKEIKRKSIDLTLPI